MNKIYIATIIVLCFSACIVNSPLLTRTQQPTNSIIDKHYALSPEIDWFTANIRGESNLNGTEQTFSAHLRIRKDSVILMSINALLGIEIIRVQLTRDSIKILNRLNSTYFKEKTSELFEPVGVPFGYKEIENIFFGIQPFGQFKEFTHNDTNEGYSLSATHKTSKLSLALSNGYVAKELVYIHDGNTKIKIAYLNQTTINNYNFPKSFDVELVKKKQTATTSIRYSNIVVNRPKKVKFSIPSSYVPM